MNICYIHVFHVVHTQYHMVSHQLFLGGPPRLSPAAAGGSAVEPLPSGELAGLDSDPRPSHDRIPVAWQLPLD